ncbi:hypothetical protein PENTCL1PPCAC_28006, partial [Pristionchus entomophagus]
TNPMFAHSPHGMAMGAGGHLQFQKWRKDEMKQREMEHRLSLFISSARLPSLIVNDAAFRELAQPRFTCPTDASQIDQMLTAQQGRLEMAVRQAIHVARRICLMIDCVAVSEKSYRVAITASVPSHFSTSVQYLLALRPLELREEDQMSSRVIETIVQQVMAEHNLSSDKIVRVITNGIERDDRSTFAGVPRLIAYRPRVLAAIIHIIDNNARVQELKKPFCEVLIKLVSQEGLMAALIKMIGAPVPVSFTKRFESILEALFPIQDSLVMVLSDAGIEVLSSEDWKLAKLLLALLSVISQSFVHSHDTIDTVLPSLMQIQGILKE